VSEIKVMREIQIQASKSGHRLWRNNVGTGWVGSIINRTADTITIKNPRPLHAGLTRGSSDLIGYTLVKITPDMVNRTVAIFTSTETKHPTRGKPTTEQLSFLEAVRNAGGIAFVARSVADYIKGVSIAAIGRKTDDQL